MTQRIEHLTWYEWLQAAMRAWREAERWGEQSIIAKDGITIIRIHENYLKQHLDCRLQKRKDSEPS